MENKNELCINLPGVVDIKDECSLCLDKEGCDLSFEYNSLVYICCEENMKVFCIKKESDRLILDNRIETRNQYNTDRINEDNENNIENELSIFIHLFFFDVEFSYNICVKTNKNSLFELVFIHFAFRKASSPYERPQRPRGG
jgi:hypothetical protein